jgi:hypothetical protein
MTDEIANLRASNARLRSLIARMELLIRETARTGKLDMTEADAVLAHTLAEIGGTDDEGG